MKPVTLKFRICQISLALVGVFGVAFYAHSADTDIAGEPLSQAATGVKPNIMFILDDSGSMGWDYTPDYVNDSQPSSASTTAACFDSGDGNSSGNDDDDSSGLITGRPDACRVGDPPFMSANFNSQYYNPAIYYRPGANADGTDKSVMNAANTSNWTAVPNDSYGIHNTNQLGSGSGSGATSDLITGYPDRVWCLANSDSATGANCLINSAYDYPDALNKYGRDSSGNPKYRFGSPYYYTMQTAQYCNSATPANASNCKSGSAIVPGTPGPGTHTFPAGEFCTDSELTNCAVNTVSTPLTAAHIFSGVRWCSDNGTLLNCQRKKIGNFKYAKHLGTTTNTSVTVPAQSAKGSITVTSSTSGRQITAITINGVAVATVPVTATNSSTSTTAALIAAAFSSANYTASASGSVVTITAVATGTGPNGYAVAVTAPSTGTTAATATLRINSSWGNSTRTLINVTANNVSIRSSTCSGSFGNNVSASGGTITAGSGTNSTSERNAVASAVASCINAATATNGGYTATSSGNVVTVIGTVAAGANINGQALAEAGGGNVSTTGSNFSGGQSSGIFTTIANMSGGAAISTGNRDVRIGVGIFNRTDIVSTTTDYPKSSQRIDCSGATCTYQEEMTNFANWYSYYRVRMQMMKSAAGRAFIPIDDTYRVGFITINPGSTVSSNEYLKIDNFDSGHKSNWYTKFYSQNTGGGTPLREALSRVGRLYAGKFDGINNGIPSADDPVQYSCQPNFAILSSDGYWNGNAGDKIDGTAMTQQDNVNVGPYSKRTDGVYDGGSSSTVGLADVALYYYQTDLRSSGTVAPDNVPTTQKDFAPHQHMTTFTLGLGLDGNMTYLRDYETASTGDFKSITQGSLNWPNPVNDSPAALDDLWHAAVNGRGVFFSASNPQELANSLSETLDALQKRVGAGAAAATSNLQPVAGDNFAFTAQYQTSDWIGDLKARTIDLGNGTVSTVPLWSAQALLDAKVYTTRNIYMPDVADITGNKLKNFCWPGTLDATCSDGSGLDATEQVYFNPNQLPQSSSWNIAQQGNATAERLVNWMRGDTTYRDTGSVAATDLLRSRVSILGDIINAQPAYVKASPFNYSDFSYDNFKRCTEGTGTACPAAQFPTPTQPRRGSVFAAANDGMLHAFETDVNNDPYFQTGGIGTAVTSDDTYQGNNTGNGEERWAYIPSMVLPNIYKLASTPYAHRYFTDGSPTVGDICLNGCNPADPLTAPPADWRTVLVAGLNSGGRGYYALDITDPLAPKLLWEFKVRKPSETACAVLTTDAVGATDDCDLGLTYGNPILSKFNGQWVVFVTSGYNNTGLEPSGTARQGDGKGYLYILNAETGAIIHKIGTGVGDGGTAGASYVDADPSGLARINNWVDNAILNNTTTAVYGGDLKGNLWRFDLDSTSSSYLTAVKVAALTTDVSPFPPQPITTKPELGQINTYHVVFVATGKFLGVSDKTDFTSQSIYAIKDDLNTNVTVTNRTGLVQQSLIPGTTTRSATSNAVDWTSVAVRGWYVNLPDTGERVSVDPQLQLGSLIVASNVPSTDTCTAGGYAWINTFDYKTGSYITSDAGNVASTKLSSSVVVGINVIQLPGGAVKAIVTTADNQQLSQDAPVAPTTFQGKRVGWREITTDQ